MRTCLVWRLDVNDSPIRTLDDAMGECASLGQGGPYSEMGWQLPSLSELTSVDSELDETARGVRAIQNPRIDQKRD